MITKQYFLLSLCLPFFIHQTSRGMEKQISRSTESPCDEQFKLIQQNIEDWRAKKYTPIKEHTIDGITFQEWEHPEKKEQSRAFEDKFGSVIFYGDANSVYQSARNPYQHTSGPTFAALYDLTKILIENSMTQEEKTKYPLYLAAMILKRKPQREDRKESVQSS